MRLLLAVLAISVALASFSPASASEQSKLLYSRGLVEFHADHFHAALHLFDAAVKADPRDVYARYYRGVTRARVQDLSGAIADLRTVLAWKPDLKEATLDLGVALVQANQYREALRWLRQAQQLPDLDAQASLFLGIAQLRLGRSRQALASFHRAADKDPKQLLAARYYEGVAHYQRGDLTEAAQAFGYVTATSPHSAVGQEAKTFLANIHAAEPRLYRAYGQVGFQYDSNVVLAPSNDVLKTAAGISEQADERFTIATGGTYIPWHTDHIALSLGYDFFQSLHLHLTGYNIQDHGPHAQIAGSIGPVQLGLLGRYDYYLLESDSFLQQAIALPWVAINDGNTSRVEISYRMRRRDFKNQAYSVRDAFNHAVAIRQYFFLGGSPDRYLSLGYQYDREIPISNSLDAESYAYDGNEVNVGVGWTFPYDIDAEASYAYRYEHYAEQSGQVGTLNPAAGGSGSHRNDNEHEVITTFTKPLTENVSLTAAYLGDFNNSNDTLFAYTRNIGSLTLEVRF